MAINCQQSHLRHFVSLSLPHKPLIKQRLLIRPHIKRLPHSKLSFPLDRRERPQLLALLVRYPLLASRNRVARFAQPVVEPKRPLPDIHVLEPGLGVGHRFVVGYLEYGQHEDLGQVRFE